MGGVQPPNAQLHPPLHAHTLATWDGKTLLRLESQLGRFLNWLPRKPACFGFVYQIALEPQKKPSVKVEGKLEIPVPISPLFIAIQLLTTTHAFVRGSCIWVNQDPAQ
jgi:hypothetical protein